MAIEEEEKKEQSWKVALVIVLALLGWLIWGSL